MSTKPAKTSELRQTTFSCKAGNAREVFLAGTFNDWNPESTPMQAGADGDWTVELDLAKGRYEFKFVIDGEWWCEPGCEIQNSTCPQCVTNSFGSMNRVLEVE